MSDIIYDAKEQMSRVNARIAQVAADYTRSQITRDLKLQAGDIRTAHELNKRLSVLGSELAYLASQKRLCDSAERHAITRH
jgi:hypothetical protein